MKKNRWIAFLLIAAMLISLLAGCGKKTEEDAGEKYTYKATYTQLDKTVHNIQCAVHVGDKLYFMAYTPDGKASYDDGNGNMVEYDTSVQALFTINHDGTGLTRLSAYQPLEPDEGMEGSSNVSDMKVSPDGSLWILEDLYQYSYNTPEDFDPAVNEPWDYYVDGGEKFCLTQFDTEGNRLKSIDLKALVIGEDAGEENYMYVYRFEIDQSGLLYFINDNSELIAIDPNTESIAFRVSGDNLGDRIVSLNDGRVAALCYGEKSELRPLDPQTHELGDGISVPVNYSGLFSGNGDYLYYYNSSTTLYGVKQDGTTDKMINWLSCDVDSDNLTGISILSHDKVLAFQNDYSSDESFANLINMDYMEITPENQRTVLKMAVMWLEYSTRNAVLKFNRTNTQYRIEVVDYSEYNTEEDYSAGQQKLNTEIISGNVPDIIDVSSLPVRLYSAKGLLADLLPLIDADTELGGSGALVKPVIDAMKEDGKLYYIGQSFTVQTAAASDRIVGNKTGWNIAEAEEALSHLQEGATVLSPSTTQADLLNTFYAWNMGNFVNWQTGECAFDSPAFVNMLNFSKHAPKDIPDDFWEDFDWESEENGSLIRDGRQLMKSVTMGDLYDYYYCLNGFGEHLNFIGYPCEDGSGNAFALSQKLAVSNKCKNKDAAWEFLRYFMLPDSDNWYWGFPLNQEKFDNIFKEAMKEHSYTDWSTGEVIKDPQASYIDDNGDTVEIYALSEEARDMIIDLINRTNKIYDYDESIMNIVMDGTAPFLDGSKDASTVAADIQNRVKLYVNEQR